MKSKHPASPVNLQNYLLIQDAAAFIGVSAATLRNWERAGKIAVRRHPINGYRLFEKAHLEEILLRAQWSVSQYDYGEGVRRSADQEDLEPSDE